MGRTRVFSAMVLAVVVAVSATALFGALDTASATRVAAPPDLVLSLDHTSAEGGSGLYAPLGSILIAEDLADDIQPGSALTFVLAAPDGFEFNPGIGSVFGAFGIDITSAGIVVTATRISVTLEVPAGALPDAVIVNDIQVRPTNLVPTVGHIYRPLEDGGTAVVRNVIPGAAPDGAGGTRFATLLSVPGTTQSEELRFVGGSAGAAGRFLSEARDVRVRLVARDRFGNVTSQLGGRIDPWDNARRTGAGRR